MKLREIKSLQFILGKRQCQQQYIVASYYPGSWHSVFFCEFFKKLEIAVSVGKMSCTYHKIMWYQEVVAMQLLQ